MPAVKPDRVEAFSEDQSKSGNLIVVFELCKGNDHGMVCYVILKAVCASVGVRPSHLVAISKGGLCKALNGNIMHRTTRDALLGGKFNVVHEKLCTLPIFKIIEEPSMVELGVERAETELLFTNDSASTRIPLGYHATPVCVPVKLHGRASSTKTLTNLPLSLSIEPSKNTGRFCLFLPITCKGFFKLNCQKGTKEGPKRN